MFQRYLKPPNETIDNDPNKLEQDTMMHKFGEYERQVQDLLRDIEEREDSIGELAEIVDEQDVMISEFEK